MIIILICRKKIDICITKNNFEAAGKKYRKYNLTILGNFTGKAF